MPAAYIIAQVRVDDPEGYRNYTDRTPALIEKWGGQFLVRGGRTEVMEGEPVGNRTVLLRFPSMEQALEFYHSDDYAELRAIRQAHSEAQFLIAEGVPET